MHGRFPEPRCITDHVKTQPCEDRNDETVALVAYREAALHCILEPINNTGFGTSGDMENDAIAEEILPPLDPAAVTNIEQGCLEIAVANASGDIRYLRRNGLTLWSTGALEDAAIVLGLAARHAPRNPLILTDLGSVLFALCRMSEAVAILRASLTLDPAQVHARITLASAYRELGVTEKAENAYRAALMLNDNAVEAVVGLGLLLAERHRLTEAADLLMRANQLGVEDPAMLACLGQVSYQLGDFSRARLALGQAAKELRQFRPIIEKYAEALLVDIARVHSIKEACDATADVLGDDTAALDRVQRRAFQTLCIYGPSQAALEFAELILTRSPDDPIIAFHRDALASLTPARSPDGYIKKCFDEFAERFDSHLVEVLDYRVPEKAGRLLAKQARAYHRALDLGCGTGLAGPYARGCGARDVVGVDLSPRMLAKAAERDCYSELREEEIVSYLRGNTDQFDLVLCLDVLVYFGELETLFDVLAPRIAPGGDLAISFETGTQFPFILATSGRYVHTTGYVAAVARKHFETVESLPTPIRLEANRHVAGALQLLRRLPLSRYE